MLELIKTSIEEGNADSESKRINTDNISRIIDHRPGTEDECCAKCMHYTTTEKVKGGTRFKIYGCQPDPNDKKGFVKADGDYVCNPFVSSNKE